jgi:hypothetical protein
MVVVNVGTRGLDAADHAALRLDRLAVVALHHREHDGAGRPGDLAAAVRR